MFEGNTKVAIDGIFDLIKGCGLWKCKGFLFCRNVELKVTFLRCYRYSSCLWRSLFWRLERRKRGARGAGITRSSHNIVPHVRLSM